MAEPRKRRTKTFAPRLARERRSPRRRGRAPAPQPAAPAPRATRLLGPPYAAGPSFGLGAPGRAVTARPRGDPFEREAEATAERVTSGGGAGPLSRLRPETLDATARSSEEGGRNGGEPLPGTVRRDAEERFDRDFRHVRIHRDARSGELSRAWNARALTHGADVHFGAGRFDPFTLAGKRLLAHELSHVVQQGSAPARGLATGARARPRAAAVVQRQASDDEPTPEQKAAALEAAAAAERVAARSYAKGEDEVAKSQDEETDEREAGDAAENEAKREGTEAEAKKAKGKAAKEAEKAEKGAKKGATQAAAKKAGAPAGPCPLPAAENVPREGRAPASPQDDPAFRAVGGNVKRTAAGQKAHPPADAKAREAQEAAVSPASEIEGKAQTDQVGQMDEAETPEFDAGAFKARLMERIRAMAPRTVEEADDFKSDNRLGGLKEEMQGKVAEEKSVSRGPVAEATSATPDTGRVEPKPVKPLPPAEPGAPPGGVCARAAVPKTKGRSEVETPLAEASAGVDQKMSEADVSDEQLASSNEPQFQSALGAKQEARRHAQEAPQEYRSAEAQRIDQAGSEAEAVAEARTRAMHGDRAQLLSQVESRQDQGRSRDEEARDKVGRDKVGRDIRAIYERTKTEVERILSELDPKVERTFDEGAAAAKQAFEDYVDAKMTAYKEERYGGWLGWARWAKDKLLGMPSEVNAFYEEGRRLYLDKMDAVIDNVVAIIGTGLTEAKAEIAKGKKEIQEYINQLPDDLKEVGRQAGEEIQGEFDTLEQSVEDKQGELIDTLANKYQENLQAIDARIEEMKAANRGLVDRALDAVVGAIQTILEIKNMLLRVLAKVADAVLKIIKDPIGFLGNLIRGLTQGFKSFVGNILTHLKVGFIGWLTGALGPAGIQIPEDLFSLKGILSLVMQILGLTWDYVRAKAVKLLGERTVTVLETAFEPFKILITEGPGGLWEYIKEQLGNLKEMVIGAIQEMLITQVIKAGVTWILGLLSPAGAFIKAAKAIYDIVMFFVERGRQILELVESIVDAVGAIAGGAIGAAARLVENALARAIPVVIGFLASLLGLGDIGKKVQKIIQRVRRPIDRAINGVLKKAKKWARKLLGRGAKDEAGKKKNHKKIALDAKKKLERPARARELPAIVREKTKQARSLEQAARRKLDRGTKLVITLDDEAKTKKDGKLNFTARVTPNDETATGALDAAGAEGLTQEALEKKVPRKPPTYGVDSLGRAEGPGGHVQGVKKGEGREDLPAVRKLPGGIPAYQPKDQRGHLIGDRFHGPSSAGNLVPMHPTLNLSTFKKFENSAAKGHDELKDQKKPVLLHMEVIPNYPKSDVADPASYRPKSIRAAGKVITLEKKGEATEKKETKVPGGGTLSNPDSAIKRQPPVNLNTASEGDLATLPAIGSELASRIVAARTSEGKFRSYEQFKNRVTGIGQARLDKITGDPYRPARLLERSS